jgi:pimeloyl-ACP methyl ester carboxylesterase
MSIVLINGINRSAEGTVLRLGEKLAQRGHEVIQLTYPTRRWYDTRNRRHQYEDALRMIRQLPDRPVDVVAHSWGCLLALRMMELGGTGIFRDVFHFAPAVDKDWIFPLEAFERLVCIHHEDDRAVRMAQLLFRGWHPWGDAGRYGYATTDERVLNVRDNTPRQGRMHSHYFSEQHVYKWSAYVSEFISPPVTLRAAD